jgi:hypothetical protein
MAQHNSTYPPPVKHRAKSVSVWAVQAGRIHPDMVLVGYACLTAQACAASHFHMPFSLSHTTFRSGHNPVGRGVLHQPHPRCGSQIGGLASSCRSARDSARGSSWPAHSSPRQCQLGCRGGGPKRPSTRHRYASPFPAPVRRRARGCLHGNVHWRSDRSCGCCRAPIKSTRRRRRKRRRRRGGRSIGCGSRSSQESLLSVGVTICRASQDGGACIPQPSGSAVLLEPRSPKP